MIASIADEELNILDFTVCGDQNEFALLVSSKQVKNIMLCEVKEDGISDFDILEANHRIMKINYIAKTKYILAEGCRNFYVMETENKKLTETIKEKLLAHFRKP